MVGLAAGTVRPDEAMARHDVSRETLEIWIHELVQAAPDRFDAEMLGNLRAQGLLIAEGTTKQTGPIQEVQPLDLLQSLGLYRKSGHVLFFHPYGISQLWFEGGEIIDARSGALEGSAAVHRIAAHEAGDFRVEVTGRSRPRTITQSTSGLALESARRIDEAKTLAAGLPSRGTVLACEREAAAEAGLGEAHQRVAALFGEGATVGEVLEASPLGELETWEVVAALHGASRLRATGEIRLPEVPSQERRARAVEEALVEVSQRISQRRQALETSQHNRRATHPSGAFERTSGAFERTSGAFERVPAPLGPGATGPRFDRRLVIGVAALAGVLVIGALWWGLSSGDETAATDRAAAAAAAAEVEDAPVDAAPRCPASMVLLPAGEHHPPQADAFATAPPAVPVPALCVDRHEVTVAEYRACIAQGHCTSTDPNAQAPTEAAPTEEAGTGAAEVKPRKALPVDPRCNETSTEAGSEAGRQAHPINCVTWDQAAAHCRERGARLPTEAEWAWIAAGPEPRPFPWGDAPPTSDRLNACGPECTDDVPAYAEPDPHVATAEVGSFPDGATPEGVHGLGGNVREWTASEFRAQPTRIDDAPPSMLPTGADRVVRGGGFATAHRAELDIGHRGRAPEQTRAPDLGFRCVVEPVTEPGSRAGP